MSKIFTCSGGKNILKTYTVKFRRIKCHDTSVLGMIIGGDYIIKSHILILRVSNFCSTNNITLKKICISEDRFKDYPAYIKIKGTRQDYDNLVNFLTTDALISTSISITNLKC